jgi:hypothetical protein
MTKEYLSNMSKIPRLFNKKPKQKIKTQPEIDTSDVYHIRKTIAANHILPANYFKIRCKQINNDVPANPIYRVDILISKATGKYVGDSFIVSKTSENEFLFDPPLGETQRGKVNPN